MVGDRVMLTSEKLTNSSAQDSYNPKELHRCSSSRCTLCPKLKGGPIARNSLGTLSAISQAILVGMLSFFHRVYIGTSSFDENTVLGHFLQERCGLGLWKVSRSTLSTNKTCDILALSFLKLWL